MTLFTLLQLFYLILRMNQKGFFVPGAQIINFGIKLTPKGSLRGEFSLISISGKLLWNVVDNLEHRAGGRDGGIATVEGKYVFNRVVVVIQRKAQPELGVTQLVDVG